MAQAEMDALIDALAQRLCDQQYPPGYNEDGISLPDGGWADGMADPSKASREFLQAWRDKARNVIALLDDAGFDVVGGQELLRAVHVLLVLRLHGQLDTPASLRAWNDLIAAHDALVDRGGQP